MDEPDHEESVPSGGFGEAGTPGEDDVAEVAGDLIEGSEGGEVEGAGAIGEPESHPSRPPVGRLLVTVALVAVLLVAAMGMVIGHYLWGNTGTPQSSPPGVTSPFGSRSPSGTGGSSTAAGAPPNAASLARLTEPALVDVDTTLGYQAVQGAGTGMVLSSGGEVLTNNHVIEGATTISVTDVGNDHRYRATVVGYDRSKDVAVLQLTGASDLQTVRLGDSSSVATGQGVVAVGNAFGTGSHTSYAAGRVTGTNQSITAEDEATGASEQLSGLIATNAAVVPGDSGGALVNAGGHVVGMVTAASDSFEFSSSAAAGYAIPINQALTIAAQIWAHQSSPTVHIGATAFLGVAVSVASSGNPGAEIVHLVAGGPAAKAGLSVGDTITAVEQHSVTSPEALTTLLLGYRPGTIVHVRYVDLYGQSAAVAVHLESGPPQ